MQENQIERIYYEHNFDCTKERFEEKNARGLRTCIECAGVFDENGKGVAVTDKRFDEHYEIRQEEIKMDEERINRV